MCIIQGKVETVHKTKLLAAPLQDQLQLTVYANQVRLADNAGAMILPFPEGKDGHCEFFDLSAYKQLFKDLNVAVWPQLQTLSLTKSRGMTQSMNSLQVHQVGSYKASIVPTLNDFERLRTDVFQVDPNVLEFLKSKYPEQYGFVVCQLDKDREYHPFGYITHRLPSGNMFLPTMHYHDHTHSAVPQNTPNFAEQKDDPSQHADWDHEIYTFNYPLAFQPADWRACQKSDTKVTGRTGVDFSRLPRSLERPTHIYSCKITNYDRNHDLFCQA